MGDELVPFRAFALYITVIYKVVMERNTYKYSEHESRLEGLAVDKRCSFLRECRC